MFNNDMLLDLGERGYLPGLVNSPGDTGFRSNLGLVNADQEDRTVIELTLFDPAGYYAGTRRITLQPSEMIQLNIFNELGVGDQELTLSAVLEVAYGGPCAAYASIVDNGTGDPILVPVQRDAGKIPRGPFPVTKKR